MRLIDNAGHAASRTFRRCAVLLGLAAALGSCGRGVDGAAVLSSADSGTAQTSPIGPAGDYPIVLGEPYLVDGQLFTPTDTTSYDEVGYATRDTAGGTSVTASHKTLPLPSYVEVTSLITGKTILVRVERRGPMTSERVIALSPGAQTQLGSSDGNPVRVRRVNPPETERTKLRTGDAVEARMDTPQSLVAVLKRRLPALGLVALGNSAVTRLSMIPANHGGHKPAAMVSAEPAAPAAPAAPKPAVTSPPAMIADQWLVQAAAFSNRASAEKVAATLGGFIVPAGKYYRVRVGPYTNRGQATAALAKVRAAGYSDATVSTGS